MVDPVEHKAVPPSKIYKEGTFLEDEDIKFTNICHNYKY